MSFDECWKRIGAKIGETFHTKTDIEFTYGMTNDCVVTSLTDQEIKKEWFLSYYHEGPLKGPGRFKDIKKLKRIRGQSYIWAIMHDERVKPARW